MARYRQFYCAFWDDPDVENYTPNQKLIHAYFFTNLNTTESGIYSVTVKKIFKNTGIKTAIIETVLRKKQLKNIYYDWDKKVVFVAKFLKHNCRGNPELIKKSIIKDMQTIHTILWHKFQEEYPHYFNGIMRDNKVLYKSYKSLFQTIIEDETEDEVDNRKDNEGKSSRFKKPTIEEIRAYCIERKNNVDPERFFDHYETRDWKPKGYTTRMKSWKAAIRTWEKNPNFSNAPESPQSQQPEEKKFDSVEQAIDYVYKEMTPTAVIEARHGLPSSKRVEFRKKLQADAQLNILYMKAKKRIDELRKNKRRKQFRRVK